MSGHSSQYFARTPDVASDEHEIGLSLPDLELRLTTDRGVFSASRGDAGTRRLLQEAPHPTASMTDVCDLGCGYGPIAVSLALRSPTSTVWAVDVNERAVALCAANATANGCDNVRSVVVDEAGDSLAEAPRAADEPASEKSVDDVRFAGLWSNPPIRIGKPALHALLTTWLDRLAPDGRAWLVVQRHLGADSLADWMTAQGWSTSRLVSRAGYRLLEVQSR
jgi:16S rRNA (guanine1207-N2)-methyltransferase